MQKVSAYMYDVGIGREKNFKRQRFVPLGMSYEVESIGWAWWMIL
jgi:hypothetical protein